MSHLKYRTRSNIEVIRSVSKIPYEKGLQDLLRSLDRQRGIYLSSGYEYPGRYSRWDIASTCPPLEIVAFGRKVSFRPLNERGAVLSRMLEPVLAPHPHWDDLRVSENGGLEGVLKPLPSLFSEEERSKQPSVFSVLRALVHEFRNDQDSRLNLIGAFGYDLIFQFDPIRLRLPRGERKDLHLFFCDDTYYMDRKKEQIERFEYDFTSGPFDHGGWNARRSVARACGRVDTGEIQSDHTPEEYMAGVERVRQGMKQGDYYEVVLRQTLQRRSQEAPRPCSSVFSRRVSPYEFLIQFADEQLVGASPEMFVRVEGSRVETCPISGTAQRTGDPMKDAANIRDLLGSEKEESELTMCTDVDRNDKSRVCVPGSVKVIARRLIESYAGVFPHGGPCRRHSGAGLRLAGCVSCAHVGGDDHGRAEKGRGASNRGHREDAARLVRRRCRGIVD
jgi:anthranilate synthase